MVHEIGSSGTTAILLRSHTTHDIDHVTKLLVALLTPKEADYFAQFLSSLVFILFFLDSIYE
jgi:hypothetical protein